MGAGDSFFEYETEEPTELGEERMMTRMPGLTVENYALVEMAFLEIQSGQVVVQERGRASESLDWLSTPIGSDRPTVEEARDILRANAAEKALDQAISRFTAKSGMLDLARKADHRFGMTCISSVVDVLKVDSKVFLF